MRSSMMTLSRKKRRRREGAVRCLWIREVGPASRVCGRVETCSAHRCAAARRGKSAGLMAQLCWGLREGLKAMREQCVAPPGFRIRIFYGASELLALATFAVFGVAGDSQPTAVISLRVCIMTVLNDWGAKLWSMPSGYIVLARNHSTRRCAKPCRPLLLPPSAACVF